MMFCSNVEELREREVFAEIIGQVGVGGLCDEGQEEKLARMPSSSLRIADEEV